jgi:hypothetical protein
MPSYGLLTNPSNEILSEINKIYELGFDYVEIAIEIRMKLQDLYGNSIKNQ